MDTNNALAAAEYEDLGDTSDPSETIRDFDEVRYPEATHAVVADDDTIARMVMKCYVEMALPGATHSDHPDGNLAFDHLRELAAKKGARVDLVVSDQLMPRMNGLDLYRGIRGIPSLRQTPFLLASAGMPEAEMRAVHDHLAADPLLRFVMKPVRLDEFNAVVADLMQTRRGIESATPGTRILD